MQMAVSDVIGKSFQTLGEGRDCIYNPNVIAQPRSEYCGYDFEDKEMQSDRLRSSAMPSDLKSVARTPVPLVKVFVPLFDNGAAGRRGRGRHCRAPV